MKEYNINTGEETEVEDIIEETFIITEEKTVEQKLQDLQEVVDTLIIKSLEV